MPIKPLDLDGLKTYPLSQRKSKVSTENFATVWEKGGGFSSFLSSLPDLLAARDLRTVISRIAEAAKSRKHVVLAMGAHVIKVGLNPVVIDLMRRGIITAVAMNGAGIVHDLEVAMVGHTSEDVSVGIGDGTFGMAEETAEFVNDAVEIANQADCGLGQAVGKRIIESSAPHAEASILAAGYRLGIPTTVHLAIGTDIVHMHPGFDAKAAGGASHYDFRLFGRVISQLENGVYLNVGSAVVLPEIFLKAVTLVRNLGYPLENFTTVNMDFIQHYRPLVNVVNRPTARGGTGIQLTGHHEIMFPIIAAGVLEFLQPSPASGLERQPD